MNAPEIPDVKADKTEDFIFAEAEAAAVLVLRGGGELEEEREAEFDRERDEEERRRFGVVLLFEVKIFAIEAAAVGLIGLFAGFGAVNISLIERVDFDSTGRFFSAASILSNSRFAFIAPEAKSAKPNIEDFFGGVTLRLRLREDREGERDDTDRDLEREYEYAGE